MFVPGQKRTLPRAKTDLKSDKKSLYNEARITNKVEAGNNKESLLSD